ncbi:hypothetical protein BASA81_008421 [Batrachochytrium salamandrivorans]|nr:hypothetical protein BASA81_008421 [Batrachochytrium salamandrivorans]
MCVFHLLRGYKSTQPTVASLWVSFVRCQKKAHTPHHARDGNGGDSWQLSLNPDLPSDIVIDFDKLEPPSGSNPLELELFTLGQELIAQANKQILVVETYQGCEQLIRQSMAQPQNEALQLQCFEGMFPNVMRIKDYHKLARQMEDFVKRTCRLGAASPSPPVADCLKLWPRCLTLRLGLTGPK